MQVAARQQTQHGSGLVDADKGFLVAMAVEPHLNLLVPELLWRDVAFGHFAHDELIEEQTVFGKLLCIRFHVVRYQGWVFVAEGEDAAGLYADEGCILGYYVFQQTHIASGETCCCVETSFRNGGTAALDVVRYLDMVAEAGEQIGEGEAQGGLLVVGEFVGEEVDGAFSGMLDCLNA